MSAHIASAPRADTPSLTAAADALRSSKRSRAKPQRFEAGSDGGDSARSKVESARAVSMCAVVVPDTRTFYPTIEQFADPCAYISTLVHFAGAASWGIVKIVPPLGWCPPCSMDARMASPAKDKTRLQAVHTLAEGVPFPDGNLYTFAEYKDMADGFKAAK